MTTFFIYLLKVIACSALFAGYYWWALRNGRFHQWNRFYILTSVALSVIIPLLNISIPTLHVVIPDATGYVVHIVDEQVEMATAPVQTHAPPISKAWIGWIACTSIVLFLLVKEIFSFVRILRLKRRSERIRIPETVLYCTDDASAPFTFFRTIFWKKGISVDSGEGRCMLRHELAHVRLGHSWDKALMQFVCCLLWMNPFFMLFRRELELVHEFAADSEGNAEELSSLILCTLYPNYYSDFTSRFFQSSIKRRIVMMTKNKKSSMNMLRKMSIVPVALIALYLFACNSDGRRHEGSNINDEIILFSEVEIKPLFNGKPAEEGFREYVFSKTVYPPEAQEKGISGRVFVEFTINTDGTLTDLKTIRGVDPLLDAEALRVINLSPKWTPGKHGGKVVRVKYIFPFDFKLNN